MKIKLTQLLLILSLMSSCNKNDDETNSPQQLETFPATNVVLSDISDTDTFADLAVSFNKATDETGILEYRIIVTKMGASFTIAQANLLSSNQYNAVVPNGADHTINLTGSLRDSDNDQLIDGNSYAVYILSVADGVDADVNALSIASGALQVINQIAAIESTIEEEMGVWGINALAVAMVDENGIIYTKGFGIHNTQNQWPASENTLFVTSSLSKLIVSVAVMQLVEQGLVDLDEDINTYFGYNIRNPNFPDIPITPRMVLSHRASLANPNGNEILELNLLYEAGTAPGLEDWIPDYLLTDGELYNPVIWKDFAPGSGQHISSNAGMCLMAHMVEVVTGMDYRDYTEDNIFIPLGMENTKFRMSEPGSYDDNLLSDNFNGAGALLPAYFDLQMYPSGLLRTSVDEWSNFLVAILNNGELNGTRILEESSVNEMVTIDYPNANLAFGAGVGLVWRQVGDWTGHTGGGFITASADINLNTKKGAVILCNKRAAFTVSPDPSNGGIYYAIHDYLSSLD
ncbi:MAG: serine hydrolase domain-containing protein [Bacteroidota bacterium]